MPDTAPAGISLTRSPARYSAQREADSSFGDADSYDGGTDAAVAHLIFGQPGAFAAPAGTDRTLTIPRSYTLHKADFGFSDADGNGFKSLIVTTLPGAGTLYYDSNGSLGGGRTAVVAGQVINAADILAGKLTYLAPTGASGTNYAHFTFQVRDDSGAGGALDTDQSPNTLTFDLAASAATPTNFGTLIDLTGLSAASGFTIQGDAAGDALGRSVSSAGDVNGDGYGDLIVGAPGNAGGGTGAGAAYVIFGKASGFGALIDLTGLAASDGFRIQGEAAGDGTGTSVSSAGDVNGDGYADIIVDGQRNDSGGTDAGAVYVIFGKASGFGTSVNLATLAAVDGFKIQGDVAGDDAGWFVSSAGDVNGDGLADIIVGAKFNGSGGTSAGAAYVIFGTRSGFGSLIDLTGLASTIGFKIQGDVAGDQAGFSVSSAGDVNGDGFSDIIVGAQGQDSGGSGAGAAYVIFGKSTGFGTLIDLTGLSATEGFKIQGDVSSDGAGWSASSAGDVNGDGYADLIVGAPGNDSPNTSGGAAYVIFGKASGFGSLIDLTGLSAVDGFKIQSEAGGDNEGTRVSSAGDVNGDGFADLLVGARFQDSGGTNAGAAYVIFGKASGFGTAVSLAGLSPTDGFKIQGDAAGDNAGYSVSSAGDLNGDGFADLAVGSIYNGSGGASAGAAYVIFGRPNTFSAPAGADRTLTIPHVYALHKGDFGFSDTDGNSFKAVIVTTLPTAGTLYYDSNGTIAGGRTTVTAGQAVSVADILAGKLIYVAPAGTSGANYDHFTFQVRDDGGSTNGSVDTDQSPNTLTLDLAASAATPASFGGLIDLTGLSANIGFKIQGDLIGDNAGRSVSSAGDVNGDGYADILVGAPGNNSGGSVAGAAYVIFGKASGFGAPIDLTGLAAADGFKIQGDTDGDYAGTSVSSAGDINGDGFADIVIGAVGNDSGGSNAGAAYVIFGRASGFGTIDLSFLPAVTGFKIEGETTGDLAGFSVSGAGDVNGDGFADIIVSGYRNDAGGNNAGAAYVIFGKSGGFGTLIDLNGLAPSAGFKIQGDTDLDYAGASVSAAGDINGDGFADIIVGAVGNDGGGDKAGAAYVIFGKSGGFGSLIDLTTLDAGAGFKIQGGLADDYAGVSVASAGDVNGDGLADIVVGAFGNDAGANGNGNAGAAYVIFGKASGFGSLIDLTGLTAGSGFKIQGDADLDDAGFSVSSAGDVNGDGYADILVGALGSDSGGLNAGAAYVIFGKASGFGTGIDLTHLAAIDGFKIQGDLAGDRLGRGVSAAGDVNGDGFADIVVGAYGNASGGTLAGAAYVIFGHSNSFTAPVGLDRTLTITRSHILHESDFGFTDLEGNGLGAVIVTSLPGAGTLYYDSNGALGGGRTPVVAGQAISAADILAGKLSYIAPAGVSAFSPNFDHFTFEVRDDSGAGGALDTDQSPNSLTFNLLPNAPILTLFGSLIDLTNLSPANGFKIQGDLAGDFTGAGLASAGDVNGDGITDFIVGAPGNDGGGSDAGAAYVIFGQPGFNGPIDLTFLAPGDGFKIQGDLAGDRAGSSVSSAGDVNGDGFADILVGASQNDAGGNYAGAAYVIFGKASGFGSVIDLTGLAATDGFRIQGDVAGNFAGSSVSSAGDVNGDGFADIIVGAYGNGSGGANAGAAYVIFGKAGGFGTLVDLTTLAPTAGFKIQGDLADDRAGVSVSSAGDVNGDGYADIFVGAKTNDGGGTDAGAAYVIFGKSGGFGTVIDLSGLAATDGFRIQGDAFSDYAGISVASAGDINGDGFADIIVGASNAGNGGIYSPGAGAAYVVFGKSAGFGPLIDLTGLTATEGFKIVGGPAGDSVGISVSSAGDVNGDGFADLLVGAPGNDGGGTDAGSAYVIFGKASGFGSVVDLTGLAATAGFRIQGDNAGDLAGRGVSAADINGDGYGDILVGASGNSGGGGNAGAAYVIYGRSNVLSAPTGTDTILTIPRSYTLHQADFGFGDVDGNAFKAVVLTTLPTGGTLFYDSNGSLGGGRTAVVAGQVISTADILAGKLTYVAPAAVSSANYDHFTFQVRDDSGAGGGLDTDQSPNTLTFNLAASAATPATFGSLIDLTGLSASTGFKIQGDAAGDWAGFSVAAAGDVNGDGFGDIIVGASKNDFYSSNAGAAYVVFGKASGFGSLIDLTNLPLADGYRIFGPAHAYAGISVASAGDVNGDGFADLIVGAYENSDGGTYAGAAYVIFGMPIVLGNFNLAGGISPPLGFKVQGDTAFDFAGDSVSSAGDVNGDGFADILIGAPGNDSGGNYAGAAYLIFGKADGFASLIDLTSLSAADGFKIQGDAVKDYSGISVSSAGDINGDGFADILVGAIGDDSGGTDAGAAYVIFGKASGFGSLIDLPSLAAADGFKIQGDFAGDNAGIRVSSAGDVNGDGYADLLVGSNNNGGGNFGAAFLLYGKAGGFGTLIDLTSITAADGFRIQSETALDRSRVTVGAAGDVNGDGYADIIVGVGNNDSGGTDAGAAYVIFGKASGFGAVFDLNNLTAATGFKIQGDFAGDLAGRSVSGAGDVNGDGFADILVGAYKNDSGGADAGAAYVIFGHASIASIAGNDAGSVAENATVKINVLANDSDPSTALAVAKVDGRNIAVGTPVTLASGAIVSLNNDGTLTYDPNGRYSTLTSTSSGETGAVNLSKLNAFTYTLAGGGSGTVTVTVNGVASVQDHLEGNSGDNVITGTANHDYFDLSQGGNDTATGLGSDDAFFLGGALTALDHVDGGGGTNDQIALQGDYTGSHKIVMAANTMVNVEGLVVLPGFSYDIVTDDGNVAAGGRLMVQGTQLNAGESLSFNGGAETDGSFLIFGSNGDDQLTGGSKNDGFYFGPGQFTGADIVNGGPGTNDQLGLDGNYGSAGTPFVLGGNVTNVEFVVFLPGPSSNLNHFNVTTSDAFVPSGQSETIYAVEVTTDVTFDGSHENNGAFTIFGGSGNDIYIGGAGNDWIFGGYGADQLTGGGGSDIFYYDDAAQSTVAARDNILDFTAGDRIDLSGIDAISGGANDAFSFIGAGAFGHHAGELQAINTAGNSWTISGDTDGDGTADFQVIVTVADSHPLTGADFTF